MLQRKLVRVACRSSVFYNPSMLPLHRYQTWMGQRLTSHVCELFALPFFKVAVFWLDGISYRARDRIVNAQHRSFD